MKDIKALRAKYKAKVDHVDIRQAYYGNDEHWRAVITTTRGRSYAAVYAGKPDEAKVRRDYEEDPRGFDPWNGG